MSDIQVQGNVITMARYDYSLTEKRIVYKIISHLQDKMQVKGLDETLFGDLILFIPMQDLVENEHYNRVKEGIKSLRKKDFEITTPEQIDTTGKGEHGFLNVGFINWAEYNRLTGLVEFEVSRKLMPYLVELAKGFTFYSLQVALSLKSVYSQRIYECCCRYRDSGKWNISIENLKIMLMIENEKTYIGSNANGNLKSKILEMAKKEIKNLYDKGDSDLYFVYELTKKSGKVFTDIKFKIFSAKNPKHEPTKAEDMQAVFKFFSTFFTKEYERKFSIKAMKRLEELQAYSEFSSKMGEIVDDFNELKKTREDVVKLARYILKMDYLVFSN